VIHVLYLHPSSPPAGRVATALAEAAPTMAVRTGTTVDDAERALRTTSVDCVVVAFDPGDERLPGLLRTVDDHAPAVPQVLASAPTAETADPVADERPAVDALVDRIVAAADTTGVAPLLDAVPGVVALVGADGAIRRWNAAAATTDGVGRGADVTTLVAPAARDRLTEALATAVETGTDVVETPAEAADGVVDREWTLTRVGDDAVAVVGLDISERTALRSELRAIESALSALYGVLSDRDLDFEARLDRVLELGCDRLDVDYGFLTRITGGTQQVVASEGAHPSLQPNDRCPLSEAYCRKTIRGDGLLGVHNAAAAGWETDPAYDVFGLGCYLGGKVVVDGDLYGTLCFADTDARESAFSGVERAFVELLTRWVSYELEERAARTKLTRQNERLSEFASIVSHDLRSPLNVAQGQLELARETGATGHLREAENALDRMERLITDLLDLARQGSLIETTTDVTVGDVATDAWSSVATEEADLIIDTDGPIVADRSRLRQLLENLFRNSVDHGSTGNRPEAGDSVEHGSTGGRPEADDSVEHGSTGNRPEAGDSEGSESPRADGDAVDSVERGSTSNRTESGDSVEHGSTGSRPEADDAAPLTVRVGVVDGGFYVADDGPGIPADERETVFDRGYSTDDGTGLGLAIVQAIAEAHGWSATVGESDAGGARFEFSGVDRPVPT
jgi:signal transduction histidine kinase